MTETATLRSRLPATMVTLAASVVVVAGMKAAQTLVVPFMLSLFLAIIAAPAVNWLQQRRVPAAVAVLLVVMIMLAILTIFGGLIGGTVNRFIAAIPQYQARLDGLVASIPGTLERFNLELSQSDLQEVLAPGSVMSWVGGGLKGLAAILSNTFMIALIVVFMLLEGIWLPVKLRVAFGEDSAVVGREGELRRWPPRAGRAALL